MIPLLITILFTYNIIAHIFLISHCLLDFMSLPFLLWIGFWLSCHHNHYHFYNYTNTPYEIIIASNNLYLKIARSNLISRESMYNRRFWTLVSWIFLCVDVANFRLGLQYILTPSTGKQQLFIQKIQGLIPVITLKIQPDPL